jgi:hypothetical protein
LGDGLAKDCDVAAVRLFCGGHGRGGESEIEPGLEMKGREAGERIRAVCANVKAGDAA